MKVHRGRLVLADGLGPRRRESQFFRATSGVKRLILIGRSGGVSLQALAWLHETAASWAHIDYDGKLLASSAALGSDNPALRRAQALAVDRPVGVEVTRYLIREKVRGQAAALHRSLPDQRETLGELERCLSEIEQARTIGDVVNWEAKAALSYWGVLAGLDVRFIRRDADAVPPHWKTLGPRSSVLTGSPRLAITPGHSLLNVAYSLGELESRIALAAVGLDPGVGISHRDQPARPSLCLDALEAIRGQIDGWIFDALSTREFARRDFVEARNGNCRVAPHLLKALAETVPLWQKAVAPVAERVAKMIARSAAGPKSRIKPVATPLTEDNRSAGRDGIRRGQRTAAQRKRPTLPPACRGCGVVLREPARTYCDDCLPDRRQEQLSEFVRSGPAAVARLRVEGVDPRATEETRAKMRAGHARALVLDAAWDRAHVRPDPEVFGRDILPLVQAIPLRQLAKVTGLSVQACGVIRRGLNVPHPRHWGALREAASPGRRVNPTRL